MSLTHIEPKWAAAVLLRKGTIGIVSSFTGEISMTNEESSTDRAPATITLVLEPEGKTAAFPRPKTVTQLLNKLGVKQCTALVIREGELLTPDRRIEIGDTITVRGVVSRG